MKFDLDVLEMRILAATPSMPAVSANDVRGVFGRARSLEQVREYLGSDRLKRHRWANGDGCRCHLCNLYRMLREAPPVPGTETCKDCGNIMEPDDVTGEMGCMECRLTNEAKPGEGG